jgi:membrane fusion protein, macrolide-specific efflux system
MKYAKLSNRLPLVLGLIVLIGGVAFSSCSSSTTKTTAALQTTKVTKGTISSEITATGNLAMPHQAGLTFGSSNGGASNVIVGTIDQILVGLGDKVKAGDVLAKLDTISISSLKQAINQAQINVNTAEQNLENAKNPSSSSTSSVTVPDPLDIESKELALENAKLNLEDAKSQLDNSVLIAPFDGLVAAVNSLVGDRVTSSTVVIKLIDPTHCTVSTLVNETDIYKVALGTSAIVSVTALDDMAFTANVTAISPSATSSSGVVNYTVQLNVDITKVNNTSTVTQSNGYPATQVPTGIPSQGGTLPTPLAGGQGAGMGGQAPTGIPRTNASANNQVTAAAATTITQIPTLKEGLSVNITIEIEKKTDVLLLPSKAVTKSGGKYTVKILNSDGKTTEIRSVTTGLSDWANTEITSGVTEGETVVLSSTSSSSSSSTKTTSSSNMGSMGSIMGGGGPPP